MDVNLDDIRQEIDKVDDKILELINSRAKLSHLVKQAKLEMKKEVYDPKREQQVLQRVVSNNQILPEDDITEIYKKIISSCRNLQV